MKRLPTPATVAEEYLAAVLEELRAIRALLEGGPPGPQPDAPAVDTPPQSPTRRTRVRPPRTA